MKKIVIISMILVSSILAAQEIEVLALSYKGSVYVKKEGKRFAESIKLDTRYGEGTLIKTGESSEVELLLPDNRTISITENKSWIIGDDMQNVKVREASNKKSDLWALAINAFDKVNLSEGKSNVVGSIRASGLEKKLINETLSETEKQNLENDMESVFLTDDFGQSKLKALILTKYKQYVDAETEYIKALDSAPDNISHNQIIDYVVTMLEDLDRPSMAEKYKAMTK